MHRIPLAMLPAFRAAARHQNLRLAAEELHLTPSAVSQQIRAFEQQLGLVLFERQGRRLKLNGAGRHLLQAADRALDALDEAVESALRHTAAQAESIRLTVLPSLAQRWLVPRLVHWQQQHPEFTIELHTSQSLVDLRRDGFHAAIRVGLGPWRGLSGKRIMDCPLIAVAAPERARGLRFGDHRAISQQPLLGSNDKWRRFLRSCGCRLEGRTVAEFNDAGLMLQAAEHDLGVALVREVLAADALAEGRLVRLSDHALDLPDDQGYWFVHLPELAAWPPLVAFRAWLDAEIVASRPPSAAETCASGDAPAASASSAVATPSGAAGIASDTGDTANAVVQAR